MTIEFQARKDDKTKLYAPTIKEAKTKLEEALIKRQKIEDAQKRRCTKKNSFTNKTRLELVQPLHTIYNQPIERRHQLTN